MAKKIKFKSKAVGKFEESVGGLANAAPIPKPKRELFSLQKHLDRGFQKIFTQIQRERPRIAHLHSSELADWCPRKFVYAKRDNPGGIPYEKEEIPESQWPESDILMKDIPMRKKWHRGNIYHDVVRDALYEDGILWGDWECPNCEHVEAEKTLCTEAPTHCSQCGYEGRLKYREVILKRTHKGIVVAGHVDCIVLWEDMLIIIEIKSLDNKMWRFQNSAEPKHIAQLSTYKWMGKIRVGIVLYVNENFEYKPFWFQMDAKYAKWIQTELDLVNKTNEPLDVPRGCVNSTCWKAKDCPWVTECFAEKNFKMI